MKKRTFFFVLAVTVPIVLFSLNTLIAGGKKTVRKFDYRCTVVNKSNRHLLVKCSIYDGIRRTWTYLGEEGLGPGSAKDFILGDVADYKKTFAEYKHKFDGQSSWHTTRHDIAKMQTLNTFYIGVGIK